MPDYLKTAPKSLAHHISKVLTYRNIYHNARISKNHTSVYLPKSLTHHWYDSNYTHFLNDECNVNYSLITLQEPQRNVNVKTSQSLPRVLEDVGLPLDTQLRRKIRAFVQNGDVVVTSFDETQHFLNFTITILTVSPWIRK